MEYQKFKTLWLTFNQAVNYNYSATDAAISIPFELLGGYSEKLLITAMKEAVKTAEYQIKVSDVLNSLRCLTGDTDAARELRAQKAYSALTSVLLSYGLYHDYIIEDRITAAIVEDFGGLESFYNNEFNDFTRNKFIRYYLDYLETKRDLPPYKVYKGLYSITSVKVIPADYQQNTLTITQSQAEKLIEHQEIIPAKISYMLAQKNNKLPYDAADENRNTTPADPKEIERVFTELLKALS